MMNLAAALYGLRVWPVKTNAAFLLACLEDPGFQAGEMTTSLIADRGENLITVPAPDGNEWMVAAMQLFAPYFAAGESDREGPWAANFGFRLNSEEQTRITVEHGGERRTIMLEDCVGATGFSAPVADGALVYKDAQPFLFTLPTYSSGGHGLHDGEVEAPMPGRVTAVEVSKGERVSKGQRLLTLEAMKMEHSLTAPFDGTVSELAAEAGAQVREGTVLAIVEAEPSSD